MAIRKSDVSRKDIVNSYELLSDGYGNNSGFLSAALVSTTAPHTVTVVLPSDDLSLQYSQDYQIDPNDIVYIYNTSGGIADGYYTVDTIVNDTVFTVVENIATSLSGNIQFRYPAGSLMVGFNPTGCIDITHNTVDGALKDLDRNKLDGYEHETLRQIIHFVDQGPGDGFASGAYKTVFPTPSIFPTNIVWWVDNSQTQKIVEKIITWSIPVPTQITWNVYQPDGVTIAHTVTDSITYTNVVFEQTRTRTIS